jgi:hypothetical protein
MNNFNSVDNYKINSSLKIEIFVFSICPYMINYIEWLKYCM